MGLLGLTDPRKKTSSPSQSSEWEQAAITRIMYPRLLA